MFWKTHWGRGVKEKDRQSDWEGGTSVRKGTDCTDELWRRWETWVWHLNPVMGNRNGEGGVQSASWIAGIGPGRWRCHPCSGGLQRAWGSARCSSGGVPQAAGEKSLGHWGDAEVGGVP